MIKSQSFKSVLCHESSSSDISRFAGLEIRWFWLLWLGLRELGRANRSCAMRITAGRMEGWAGDWAAVMCTVDTATGVCCCCCCWSIASVSEQLRRVCASWPCNVGRPRPIDRCCHSVLLASSPADQRTYRSSTTQSLPSNTRRLGAIVRNSRFTQSASVDTHLLSVVTSPAPGV